MLSIGKEALCHVFACESECYADNGKSVMKTGIKDKDTRYKIMTFMYFAGRPTKVELTRLIL